MASRDNDESTLVEVDSADLAAVPWVAALFDVVRRPVTVRVTRRHVPGTAPSIPSRPPPLPLPLANGAGKA